MGTVSEILLPTLPLLIVAAFTALLFALLLVLFRTILRGMNKREIRRALALVITSTYIGLVAMAISGLVETSRETMAIIDGLNKAFMVVVAFYFGTRAVERGLELKYGVGDGGSNGSKDSTTETTTAGEHPRKEGEASE